MIMQLKNGGKSPDVRYKRSWPLLPLILFLILAAASALLHFEKSRCQKQMLKARQQFNLTARAAPIEAVKVQRGWFYKSSYYLGYAWRNSYAVADFVRRLSGIVRPPLRVLDLKIVPGWQNSRFELAVELAADKREQARELFTDFYKDMQGFTDISQMTFSETTPPVLTPGQAANGFIFAISGQMEME
jgi:hypothetical protein